MIVGIDASNIRAGGGLTHLVELLRAAHPESHGIQQVVLWAAGATLSRIDDRAWLRKIGDPLLNKSLLVRSYWQRFRLDREAKDLGCDLLFVPGGTYSGSFRPYVTMSRNLLPFQLSEARRYGLSWMFLKLVMLRGTQSYAMKNADGVIFLTAYGREVVMDVLGKLRGPSRVIHHGVNKTFEQSPRPQRTLDSCSNEKPFRLLYVSIVTVYKHQANVVKAVIDLRNKGVPVHLDLVGNAYPPTWRELQKNLLKLDPTCEAVTYHGSVAYPELHRVYQEADAFVFASSCETFGQIVTEAMSAGLPIACSDTGTMRELLGQNAVYFDPEKPGAISDALMKLVNDSSMRATIAIGAFEFSRSLSWERCAHETFDFIAQIAAEHGIH